MAAAESFSATVQWLLLATAERIAVDGVSASLVKRLNRFAGLRSEMISIAARLAADLGLERLYYMARGTTPVMYPCLLTRT